MTWNFNGNRVVLSSLPKRTLKITGTRLGAVLGINPYSTPFRAFLEITKTAKVPFEGNKYTNAGNVMEPKQIEYIKKNIDNNIEPPPQELKDKYDFYPNEELFGGMWDAMSFNSQRVPLTCYEFKTTKRAEDWADGVPLYYLVQALLYARLSGCARTRVVVTFLNEEDYDVIDLVEVNENNTVIYTYDTIGTTILMHDGREYNIDELIDMAREWYNEHVLKCESPYYDEKKDAEILGILRCNPVINDTTVEQDIAKLNQTLKELNALKDLYGINDLEKEVDALRDTIKTKLTKNLDEKYTKSTCQNVEVLRVESKALDTDALKRDGLYDMYCKTRQSVRLTIKEQKGEL